MERIVRLSQAADLSIRRGIGFAYIAIGTAMAGMAFDGYLTVKTGAILSTLVVAVLGTKALRAPRRPYKRTELWIVVDKDHRVPEDRAQDVIGHVLRERYLWHAQLIAGVAVALWLVGFAILALR